MFSLNNILHNKYITKYLMVLGIVGIAIIFLSNYLDFSQQSKTQNVEPLSEEEYCVKLEKEVTELIRSITGDDNVRVVIALESGVEYLYASNKNINTDTKKNISGEEVLNDEISDKSEESYIIIKTSDGEQPLLISALAPKVRGVAVVCDSGYLESTSEIIKDSISTLLDLSESNISLAGVMNSGNEE